MRKGRAKERILTPDPKFNDKVVAKFVNNLMFSGKKSTAYRVFYEAMDMVADKAEEEVALATFHKALKNITPGVEVKSRRVGGATFQIPQPVRQERKDSMAMKWMIMFARKRNGKTMGRKLADEILAAANEEGGAFKKKEDTHRMAEANKAFSHFRF